MTEISVRMQVVIEKLNEENGALQVALDNANDTIARLRQALNDSVTPARDDGPASLNEVANEHEIYICGHGCGLRYHEVDDWNWWSEDNPIRYTVKAEGLTLADYVEGCNQ